MRATRFARNVRPGHKIDFPVGTDGPGDTRFVVETSRMRHTTDGHVVAIQTISYADRHEPFAALESGLVRAITTYLAPNDTVLAYTEEDDVCPVCGGDGYSSTGAPTCTACDGTGAITHTPRRTS